MYSKGITLKNLLNDSEAISYFDEALKTNPNDAETLQIKGNSLINLGKNDEAINCYDEALKIANTWEGMVPNNLQQFSANNSCYYEAFFRKILKNKAIAFINLGNLSKAISCYDQAIEIDPKDVES